jgi:enoyl-CoA hydratase/carnithine racemase
VTQPQSTNDQSEYETILYETSDDHVATITLNRAHVLNAFNQQMCDDFVDAWNRVRLDDEVHTVVLRAAGERAFSTGVDIKGGVDLPPNVWAWKDPGASLTPKSNCVWKPVICAVHGIAAGGAFYWINSSDIVLCSDDATFFDPHVSYGKAVAFEGIGLSRKVALGEALRIALMGLDERVSAARAFEIGLVTEVTTRDQLWGRAHEVAAIIATKPSIAVQATVKAIWSSLDQPLSYAYDVAMVYPTVANFEGRAQVDADRVLAGERPQWTLR